MARKGMKWQVHEAVQTSKLPPFGRLLMFVLADLADTETGVIPAYRTPSIKELSARSGMSKASVIRHKDDLVNLGWVLYREPTWAQRSAHEPGQYAVRVGRNPDPKPMSQAETSEEEPNRSEEDGPMSQGETSEASGPDPAANLDDQEAMSQTDTSAMSHPDTSPTSHSETSEEDPKSHSETSGVSERDIAMSHSETSIRNRPTDLTDLVAADAEHPAPESPKATGRKRSGGTRKKAAAKEPGPHDTTAQELTVAFFEHAKDRNVQTFVAVRGVVKTALGRGVPRDALARAMVGVLDSGLHISGQTLTVELNRMRKAAADSSETKNTTGQQRLAAAAEIADEMRRLDEAEAEANYQPPILFVLPPGRTA